MPYCRPTVRPRYRKCIAEIRSERTRLGCQLKESSIVGHAIGIGVGQSGFKHARSCACLTRRASGAATQRARLGMMRLDFDAKLGTLIEDGVKVVVIERSPCARDDYNSEEGHNERAHAASNSRACRA